MKKPFPFRQAFAILLLFVFIAPVFFSCETHNFDSDKRQIMAKDEIRSKLHKIRDYDLTGFREDSVDANGEAGFKKVIRYQLDFQYIDSSNALQKKTGDVFFTPDGKSIIHSTINDR